MNFRLLSALLIALLTLTLAGCLYGTCMNGPCALEHERMVRSIKPYLHYWEKPGATERIRRQDSLACGTANTPYAIENVVFAPPASRQLSDEEYTRLFHSWERCMLERGYRFTGKCYDNEIGRRKPACAGRTLEPLPSPG